ncbi:methylated-DNA--[protein]-cysteine S-methyltransferase [Clostridium sp. ZS2-4]|uniref:methylated-DNA--[protein]-cysteine S-methyltransferase n=1 Tax=Clostridium sp. ZS2-4 TaxID=2987703 RepID=UPI00227A4686|nr:methylated-DNA--[protein]-cysteine S-methyltransferase [Clostridium sp. ZS2-4]MCY6355448.1 methylated-DNA--[protein]-cysteine S-methyltransferase [Clostridium sp. ZS2-4]
MKQIYSKYNSPLGKIYIVLNEKGICRVEFGEESFEVFKAENKKIRRDDYGSGKVIEQLDEYFKGKRKKFTIPLSIQGSIFQEKVWMALISIPYGDTKSYGEIGKVIGKPKGAQAIGQANKANKIPIFIPCHRVISKDGNIGGYMGKINGKEIYMKQFLLDLERTHKLHTNEYLRNEC